MTLVRNSGSAGGRPAAEAAVYDDLVREYDIERRARSADRRRRTLLRRFSDSGSGIDFVTISEPPMLSLTRP
ncbi:hypothetical protein [Streptomyces noursei]|uniref:Uncharacterized protein n=1 Tax=Streptomyces yunnanensis TaxID=156453 RepID=A0A9X8QVK8_9ACTN|nr:hypothetical protein [Streptomyces noursei]SHM46919.1 hypothetical protein SAMN05216268_111118 [Streptomyces yunnanensis]